MKSTRKKDYDSIFASNIRKLLDTKSMSKTQIAKQLGVKQQTVSQWADGSTTPALKHLMPLASCFGISVEELLTGVAPENREMYEDTGLSNEALELLKWVNTHEEPDNDMDQVAQIERLKSGRYLLNGHKDKILLEFLSIIIETIKTRDNSFLWLAHLCMDYIAGAHEPLLEFEELDKRSKQNLVVFAHADRPDHRNDDLDFRTYRLARDFEYFIQFLTKDTKIANRVKLVYKNANLQMPDYSDSRTNQLIKRLEDYTKNNFQVYVGEEIKDSDDEIGN